MIQRVLGSEEGRKEGEGRGRKEEGRHPQHLGGEALRPPSQPPSSSFRLLGRHARQLQQHHNNNNKKTPWRRPPGPSVCVLHPVNLDGREKAGASVRGGHKTGDPNGAWNGFPDG